MPHSSPTYATILRSGFLFDLAPFNQAYLLDLAFPVKA